MRGDLFKQKFLSRPLSKTAFDNGFQTKYWAEDPAFFVFSIFFDANSPLLNPATNTIYESAERYFLNQDDDRRAGYVVELRERLASLVNDHQYFLQSISGLNQYYTKGRIEAEEPIEITTLESMDMRITKIKELYNRVSYDYVGKKDILPENLRWLNMKILISDTRKLAKWVGSGFEDATPSIDTLCFTLNKTEIFTEEGHSYLETVINGETEMAENNLKFKGGVCHMDESVMGIGSLLKNDAASPIQSMKHQIRDTATEHVFTSGKDKKQQVEDKTSISSLFNNIGSQLKTGAIRDAKNAAISKVLTAKRNIGTESVDGLLNNAENVANGYNIYDILKGKGNTTTTEGRLEVEQNKSVIKDILEQNKLSEPPSESTISTVLSSGRLSVEDKYSIYMALVKEMLLTGS